MKIAFFDAHRFEKRVFLEANQTHGHEIHFFESHLNEQTSTSAQGYPCVCIFVNDRINRNSLKILADGGTRLIALRSAGYNHVDLKAADQVGIKVVRVPEYSPHAVAEHAVALILSLNRKIHRAYNRVREGNFSLEGLEGFDLFKRTVGIIGAGRIGSVLGRILLGFGCRVLAFDLNPNPALESIGVTFVGLEELLQSSDVISLHVPLTEKTRHIIDDQALAKTKAGVMVINTGRGGLIDTRALIKHLKNGHIGSAGLDVYEEEEGVFFEDLSGHILQDDILARLMTFPNVLLTSHQAFLTQEALQNIAHTTLKSVSEFEGHLALSHEVSLRS